MGDIQTTTLTRELKRRISRTSLAYSVLVCQFHAPWTTNFDEWWSHTSEGDLYFFDDMVQSRQNRGLAWTRLRTDLDLSLALSPRHTQTHAFSLVQRERARWKNSDCSVHLNSLVILKRQFYVAMLTSFVRPISRLGGAIRVVGEAKSCPTLKQSSVRPVVVSQKRALPQNGSKRFYAGHHHEEEAPKPYKRTTLAAKPQDAQKSADDLEREVKGIEGWIFGRKVSYLDPLKPIEDTPEQKSANGWLFNQKVRPISLPFDVFHLLPLFFLYPPYLLSFLLPNEDLSPSSKPNTSLSNFLTFPSSPLQPRRAGEPITWHDWEPTTYIGTLLAVLIVAAGLWARPDSTIQVWATEEARERKIIKARRELEQSGQNTLWYRYYISFQHLYKRMKVQNDPFKFHTTSIAWELTYTVTYSRLAQFWFSKVHIRMMTEVSGVEFVKNWS